jgi:cyclic dehypoxanthinyl futalosine synthase
MKRLSYKEALDLYKNTNLKELGEMALAVKRKLHPKGITSFIIDRNINYTNTCFIDCDFCAFYRKVNDKDSYTLSKEQIANKIDELIEIGGNQILFQGGVHPLYKIDYYEDLVEWLSKTYPNVILHGFSTVEIAYISKISNLSYDDVFKKLKAKGLTSMPGAGAEILSDRVRNIISPKKGSSQQWIDIHKSAHNNGIKTSSTMMYGTVETDEEIIEHLDKLRTLQDETNGFRSFIAWSFQGNGTKLAKKHPEIKPSSSNQYLRILSIARLYLDNIPNIQSSWVTQGSFIGQLALLFGANDLGSTMMEENVVSATGTCNTMNTDEMKALIRDIGDIPAKRNTYYDILETYE